MENSYEFDGAIILNAKCFKCDCELKGSEEELEVMKCPSCDREWEINLR